MECGLMSIHFSNWFLLDRNRSDGFHASELEIISASIRFPLDTFDGNWQFEHCSRTMRTIRLHFRSNQKKKPEWIHESQFVWWKWEAWAMWRGNQLQSWLRSLCGRSIARTSYRLPYSDCRNQNMQIPLGHFRFCAQNGIKLKAFHAICILGM